MAAAVSCGNKARIDGTISEAPSSEVIVKLLNFNQYQILDTVKTDASGRFSYKAEIEKGQPEFIYVFYKDTKVASLLLEAGDKVKSFSEKRTENTMELFAHEHCTCVNPFVDNINAVNRIYNEPVEVLFDSENLYFSLPEATPA